MIVGCYSLDLYCDAEGCEQQAIGFTGRNRREATKEARADGWWVRHAGRAHAGLTKCSNCRPTKQRRKKA